MASRQHFAVQIRKDPPRRVVLHANTSAGTSETELSPLGAAWLAGQLFAGAVGLINEGGALGVVPKSFAPVVLWEDWGTPDNGASWTPQFLSTVHDINREVSRCQAEGIPYRLSVDLITDPLEPKPKE